jgi:hypothetical protein
MILSLQVVNVTGSVSTDLVNVFVAYNVKGFHILIAKAKAYRELRQVDHANKSAFVVEYLHTIISGYIQVAVLVNCHTISA